MAITLATRRLRLRYHHEFRISRGGESETTTILVELLDGPFAGYGEAIPFRYLGWDEESIERALAEMAPRLAHADPSHVSHLSDELLAAWPDQRGAVAAVVGALWDLHGQRLGQPVWRLLGLDAGRCGLTDFTLGLADRATLLAKADEAAQYPILKIKCGGPADLDNVRALAEHTGKRFYVDANGGWSVAQAADLAGELARLGVEMIEQPVPAGDGDAEALAAVKAVSPLPIVADESLQRLSDVPRLVGAVDGVNIKLEKVGGLSAGLATLHAARACGLKVMLGGFGCSSVAVTTVAQLAPLADWKDLDGALLIANDPFTGLTAPEGRIRLPDGPGLGVRPVAHD